MQYKTKLDKNEYTAFSLGMAPRLPLLATALPFGCMIFLSKGAYSTLEQAIYLTLSFCVSATLLLTSSMFRSLFTKIKKFRLGTISFYSFFSFLLPILFLNFSTNALVQFILTLLTAIALVTCMLFYTHFYSHKYMQEIDWFTTDKLILEPPPSGSPIGNKIAVALLITFLALIVVVIYA